MKNDLINSQTHLRNPPPKPSQPPQPNNPTAVFAEGRTWGAWLSEKGVNFRVWAPLRKSVEVVVERAGQNPLIRPLQKRNDGTFSETYSDVQPGDLYRYQLDGQDLYPDPASRYQPQGVHGPSQIVDSHAFSWTDQSWTGIPLEKLVIYELHVGAFTPAGTFTALIERLPYLVELGITALEFMPIADFAGSRNWGYDGVALYAPAHSYGTPDDLRQLINAAHQAGLAVLLDVVYNHLGPDGNYTEAFSPFYITDRPASLWGKSLNFDGENSLFVRDFFIQNALQWIREYHFDGLRLDATHAIHDTSSNHILADLAGHIRKAVQDRSVHIIAEDNRNEISLLKPVQEQGMQLDAVWSDDFHHQMRRFLAGDTDGYYVDFSDRLEDLLFTLQHGWFYTGQKAPFFNGPRGTLPGATPLQQFIFFIQNHDQVGNRAWGDRLHQQISPAAYRAVSALLLSLPETPLLFMGQEWASENPFLYFTDHHQELGRQVSEGRKKEFKSFAKFTTQDIPDPQDPDTFQKSKLNWTEVTREPHEPLKLFYQRLIHFRLEDLAPVRHPSEFKAALLSPSALLLRRRSNDGKTILIILQMKGRGIVDLSSQASLLPSVHSWEVLFTSEDKSFCPDPMFPVIHLADSAPLIEFSRPGSVFLKEHTPTVQHA